MFGLTLFYVGAVLLLNGIWLRGGIGDKEITVINIFVGFLSVFVALYLIISGGSGDATTIKAAALTLLFAFTYLWVAANQFLGADGQGLGWFCLFVSLTALVVAAEAVSNASGVFGIWNAFNWSAWAILWFCFFLLLTMKKAIMRPVGNLSIACGIVTGWIPGFLLLQGFIGT
ncbi:AmiS/UreI family transporter [Salinisphaera sp. RV14]|uniref:AmiS/UreI family transporter n=1 Tax=unclassified Salinisphaera TaxID=2649847 RepID=UPI003F844A73